MDEVERLIEQLKSGDVEARESAAVQLGDIKDKRAVPALIGALKDEDGYVRSEATYALGEIGDASAVPALIEALKDENECLREDAAWALGKIGKSAVPALIEALKDKDRVVRKNAARALGEIGDASAVPALIGALTDVDVRMRAAWALGKIAEGCETIEELEKVEKDVGEGSAALRKERNKGIRIDAQIRIARVVSEIAQKKDELAPERDLLLEGRPRPPKKGGREMCQAVRRVRNG